MVSTTAATYGIRDLDDRLRVIQWADYWNPHPPDDSAWSAPSASVLLADAAAGPVPMAHSPATGTPLVSNGHLGIDRIALPAGTGFEAHTHPGDHLLIPIAGLGTITYNGHIYPTRAGEVYMIEGLVPHAVGAITDHAILAVGCPHMPVGSPERMRPVAYQTVLATFDTLTCLICDLSATYPALIHETGCTHCPCPACSAGTRPAHPVHGNEP